MARDVVHQLNLLARPIREHSLDALRGFAGSLPRDRSDVMLTWGQVHEMHRAGICFGAHTMTHAFLDELDAAEARQEIEGSIGRLREELGPRVESFAYPRGRVTPHARRLLAGAGVETAVTTEPGRNGPRTDRLDLKRLDAGYLHLDGGFDPVLLEVEIQGWFNRFRHA